MMDRLKRAILISSIGVVLMFSFFAALVAVGQALGHL